MPAYNYNTRTLENSNSPSGRYNPVTPGGIYGDATGNYTWRLFGSDALRAGAPAPVSAASSLTGNWLRTGTDRLFGATNDRDARDYRNYMRDMMQDDSRAMNPGVMSGLSDWVQSLFGSGRNSNGSMGMPRGNMPAFLGQGNGSRPEHSTNLTAGYGIDAEGNTVIPRYSWEEGYGQGDGEELPYGEGQGMGRGAGSKPAQNYQGNRAGTGGQVVARRIEGDTANNRALESMAEGLLGQDAVSRMNASSRQSIDMMNRMFGNKFK